MEAVGEYAAPYLPGLLWQGTNEEPVGPSYAHLAAPLLQHAQDDDLRRQQRDPEGIISKMVLGLLMDLALKRAASPTKSAPLPRKPLSPRRAKTFSGKHYDRDDHMVWQQALGKKGWFAYTWPKNTAVRAGT
jgi:hypothetical protein